MNNEKDKLNVYKYMDQEEFNALMMNYEQEHYSSIYEYGVLSIRLLTISMLAYLVVYTF